MFTRLSARGRLTGRTLEFRRRADQVVFSSVYMLARCGGELTVPQSLPVGDDGRWMFEASVLLRGTRSSWSLEGVSTVDLPVIRVCCKNHLSKVSAV